MLRSRFILLCSITASIAALATDTPSGFDQVGLGQYPCAVARSNSGNDQDSVNQMAFTDGPVPFLSSEVLASCPEAVPARYPFNRINIQAPDDSIRATFIPFGATLVDFWTRDRSGTWRDIHLGLDNTTTYAALAKSIHPYFGAQVGRYANRIKNGIFKVDGETYHTPKNENGTTTLHGGKVGYDQRSHHIESLSATHISFVLHDADGEEGFPGAVIARASYTLLSGGEMHIKMDANVTSSKERTPIMLSHHAYWALHGYKDSDNTVLNHSLHLPFADQYIEVDDILVPTGKISNVKGTPLDFQDARTFSERYNRTKGQCGSGCQGWDNCLVMSKSHPREDDVLSLTSPETGIRMRVKTDQKAMQIYTCNGVRPENGQGIPRKFSQGGNISLNKLYENHSCVVVELQDYIDGINNPGFGRNQFYSKERPYHWEAEYKFDVVL